MFADMHAEGVSVGEPDLKMGNHAQLTADVTADYLTLVTNARTVELQEQNAAKARQELVLAQEKYKVGAATYLDLANARATYERAESDRINAIYTYHISFAQLENAVGRPLR